MRKRLENVISVDRNSFSFRLAKFTCITLVVMVVLEVFVFNYKSFVTIGKGYEQRYIPVSELYLTGLTPSNKDDNIFKSKSFTTVIETPKLDIHVATVYLDIEIKNEKRNHMNVEMYFTEATTATYRKATRPTTLIKRDENSKYEVCAFAGTTPTLKFFPKIDKGEEIEIKGIAINQKVPFGFNAFRVLIPTLSLVFIYCLFNSPFFKKKFKDGGDERIVIGVTTTMFMCLLLFVVFMFYTGGGPSDVFSRQRGDQVCYELVEAFKSGQVWLLNKVPNDLLELSNPYDYNERSRAGINFLWDHLLYEGKYYSYYGIAPVLTLFLPYNLITGLYFPTIYACLLYAIVGTMFLSASYLKAVKNWFSDIPINIVACGQIMLLLTSGTLFCVCRPQFYEMSEAAGFAFFTAGLYFLLSSGIFTKDKIKLTKVLLSTTFASLAVLSRPTFAIYVFAICLWLLYGLFEYRKKTDKSKTKTIKYVSCSLLPFAVFGGVQMAYNYVRFGSLIDFGIKYSLTINDFTNTQFHFGLMMISFWNFLFSVPIVKSQFPFFFSNIDKLGVNGYYFAEAPTAMGLLWRAPIIFALLKAPSLLKGKSKKEILKVFVLLGLPCIVLPLLIIAITWESGHALRYNIDFAWQMILGALCVVFVYYRRNKNEQIRRLVLKAVVLCTVLCVIFNLATVLQFIPGEVNTPFIVNNLTRFYYKMAQDIAFWN